MRQNFKEIITTKLKTAMPMIIYAAVYLTCFFIIEHLNFGNYHIIQSSLDDKIPFCEYFIIPYFLWFVYMSVTLILLLFVDEPTFKKTCAALMLGMTLFLIVSIVYPNELMLRPEVLPNTNLFSQITALLYTIDTSTNVLPSLHVYNSLIAMIGILESRKSVFRRGSVKSGAVILTILIILSTLFLKQHSVIDMAAGCVMGAVFYPLCFHTAFGKRLCRIW